MMPFDRRELSLLAVVLLLATVLRVGWPTLTEFKFDEARMAALALELAREGRLPLVGIPSSAGFGHSPISVYLWAPGFLFTTDPIPAIIYGGLVNVAAVALCWWLGRRWRGGGRWAALVAALLFAVSPWLVAFGRKIWQIAFVPLLVLAFAGLMVSALVEKPTERQLEGRGWGLAWALAVYALLVQVHPSAVTLAPAVVLWLILFRRQIRLGPLLVGGVLAMLTTAPFLFHQIQNDWPVLAGLGALPGAVWDLSAVRLVWEVITGRGIAALAGDSYPLLGTVPQLGWISNLVGWLAVGAALWLAYRMVTGWRAKDGERRRGSQVDLILLSWLVAPVVLTLRHSVDLHLHSFALVAPAAYLITGRAAEALFGESRLEDSSQRVSRVAARTLKIGSLAGLALLVTAQVVALVLMARFVATHDTPGGFGTPLRRYLNLADQAVAMAREAGAAEVLVVGQGNSPVVDETPAIFDVLLRERVAYRFVDGGSAALFPPHRAVALLAPDAGEAAAWYQSWPARDVRGGYRLVVLDGSWPQGDLAVVPGPRVFQNGVALQGYRWQGSAIPSSQAQFWLLWQVLWLSPDDTHFYAHLLDEEGQIWAQQDLVGYPTTFRSKGDRIINKFDIIVSQEAQPGPYWIRTGLYLYPQVVNVPVIDDAGNPVADAVVLGPVSKGP
jgi:hypothetical protein